MRKPLPGIKLLAKVMEPSSRSSRREVACVNAEAMESGGFLMDPGGRSTNPGRRVTDRRNNRRTRTHRNTSRLICNEQGPATFYSRI